MKISLSQGQRLELAVARLIEGREDQLFGKYFPTVGPVLSRYDARPAGSFTVVSSEGLEEPGFGALFIWPSSATFAQFHQDPEFRALAPLRDEALSLLSNGHFFAAKDLAVEVPDEDLALQLVDVGTEIPGTLLSLRAADDSPNDRYAGKALVLCTWSDAATAAKSVASCRIRFNT
ncbi:MAG: hypothetical protein ACRBN8_22090 [Nannocystales bacterium]